MEDISDNLLYYHYNIKHLIKLEAAQVDKESPDYLSAYHSFAGIVYENYLYEKLLLYAKQNPRIGNFILKGPHAHKTNTQSNALHVNNKGQIIYKTRAIEINEFDGLFFNDKEIIFIEMTLIKSVTNLRRRLRKKKALLEILFPNHNIKALIILNQGVSGRKRLPEYCTVWLTKSFDVSNIFNWLKSKNRRKRKPFLTPVAPNLVSASKLQTSPFRYYNSLSWMLHKLRSNPNTVLNMNFLKSETCTRYIDLFTKVYIGYIEKKDFENLYPEIPDVTEKVAVAIEKNHNDILLLTYFMQYSRKKLLNIVIENNKARIVKKDTKGISITEVFHILRMVTPSHKITIEDINTIEQLLRSMD
ncbi:hypothetical protein [Sulfurospirillum arcachonense]|uniref:hypothetical protein n=1 Tax=Sulfurospirillum arcachonense TaxID=57666 RepID=UPI0004B8B91F|nr:hypothetical protein [Sulfurospirillum arcachonense]